MQLQFDLRSVARKDLLQRLEAMERIYGKLHLTRNADHTLTAEPEPKPTSDLQGMAQLGNTVHEAVANINLADRLDQIKGTQMSITGAKNLSSQFKDALAQAKSKINAASDNMSKAVTNLNTTADAASKVADQVQAEADELQASLGQLTNFPPE